MKCVICGGSATKVVENRIGRYRDERVEVRSELFRCDDCKEGFLDPTQMKAHNRAVKNEIRKKYGLLPPEKIEEIRKKLGLTQAELEELLDTGDKVVVRWESGKVIQSGGHDNLLRLLDREPGMLKNLRQIQKAKLAEQERYRRESNPKGMVAQAI
jgi:HTH-type transcriptional regulator / antitoxin MqsA